MCECRLDGIGRQSTQVRLAHRIERRTPFDSAKAHNHELLESDNE
jgi:hypothetical protein